MNNFMYIVNNYIDVFHLKMPKNKVELRDTQKVLLEFIKNLIFNVVSIACIITFINNDKSIKKPVLKILIKYINDKCTPRKIKGGMPVMPSEFYGVNSGRYDVSNFTGEILNVDPASGIIRPQIGGGGSRHPNNPKINSYISDEISSIMKYYKLRVSDSIKIELIKIINININCMFKQLKSKVRSNYLGVDDINELIKQNKNLDIFK